MKRFILTVLVAWGIGGILSPESYAAVEKTPYLLFKGSNTEMTVIWQMTSSQNCTIEWGLDTNYGLGSVQTTEYGSDFQHQYTITGLTPGTKYYYNVVGVGSGSFYTAPADTATSVKFLAYGDTRNAPAIQNNVAGEMISTYTVDPAYQSLCLFSGDYIGDGNMETQWTAQWFPTTYANLVDFKASVPIVGSMGNHEGNGTLFKKYYPMPYESGTFYWSFDYGPVHVTVAHHEYEGDGISQAQIDWVANDLMNSTKPWKILMFHAPAYSAGGGHPNSTPAQNAYQPLCEQYGVDVVVTGHNHYYARCEVNGVQHLTLGGGGAPAYSVNPSSPYFVIGQDVRHHAEFEINGDLMTFVIRRVDGSVLEAYQISHGPQPVNFIENPITASRAVPDVPYTDSIADAARDPNNDPITFTKVSGPAWLNVAADGTLSGTPTASDLGLNIFTVGASDIDGSDSATLEINVSYSETLVGGSLLNGDFNANPGVEVNFVNTPEWYNLQGNQTTQCTRDNLAYDGTQNGVLVVGREFALDTGYTIAEGDVFDVSYVWRDAFNWVDGSDQISVSLYVSSDNTLTGVRTDLVTAFSGTSTLDNTYELVDQNGIYTASPADAGKTLFLVLETTSAGFARIDNVELVVAAATQSGNNAPVFSADPINKPNATEDAAYSDTIAGSATDADSDPLSYSRISGPAWLNVASAGALSGTPTQADVGANSWTVQVSDGNGGSDTATLNITVDNVNDAPVFTVDPINEANAAEGVAYSGSIANATDDDNDPLTYSKVSGPVWLSVAANGTLSGTPGAGDLGVNSWTVQVIDGNGGSDTAALNITVIDPNAAVDDFANADVIGSGTVSGSYIDTQASDNSYEAITEVESGGKPANRHSLMDHRWTINVTGGNSIIFYVEAYHGANSEGDDFVFAYSTDNVSFTDMVTVTKTADDDIAELFALPNTLSGTVYIRVTDTDSSQGNNGLDTVYVDAMYIRSSGEAPPNQAPTFSSDPVVEVDGAVDISYSATLSDDASDPEADPMTFSKVGGPVWLSVASDGTLSGTPTAVDEGLNSFTVQVDATGGTDTATLNITVNAGMPSVHVSSIVPGVAAAGGPNQYGVATVTIVDAADQPVSGATVSGTFTGSFSESGSAVTDGSGVAVIQTVAKTKNPSFTFTVDSVTASGYAYDPASNVETSDSY